MKQNKNCSVGWQGGDDDRMIMAVKSYASTCIVFVSRNGVVVVVVAVAAVLVVFGGGGNGDWLLWCVVQCWWR